MAAVKQRIYSIIPNALNDEDRQALAALLVKAGYTARKGRGKNSDKPNSPYIYFVEFEYDDQQLQKEGFKVEQIRD